MTLQTSDHQRQWGAAPYTSADWVARARAVATHLAVDAVARDRANQPPHAEVAC